MANRPLVGQVPVQVNHVDVTSITNVQAKRSRQNTVKQGAFGAIGTAKGQPRVTGSFELALFKLGQEIDIEQLWDSDEGFTLTYQEGDRRYLLTGVNISDDDMSAAQESGDVKRTVNFTATDKRRIN